MSLYEVRSSLALVPKCEGCGEPMIRGYEEPLHCPGLDVAGLSPHDPPLSCTDATDRILPQEGRIERVPGMASEVLRIERDRGVDNAYFKDRLLQCVLDFFGPGTATEDILEHWWTVCGNSIMAPAVLCDAIDADRKRQDLDEPLFAAHFRQIGLIRQLVEETGGIHGDISAGAILDIIGDDQHNPAFVVDTSELDMEDLLNVRPGGIVRMRSAPDPMAEFEIALAHGMHLSWSDEESCFILFGAEEPGSVNKSHSSAELIKYFLENRAPTDTENE